MQDWSKGIAPFENWWKRIDTLIGKADTIVFVLSPDAVASKYIALKEIDYAASLNKRFAPVVCRKVDDTTVPEALRNLHYIFLDDLSRFDAGADHLAAALQIDLDWIRKHSEYGGRDGTEMGNRWPTGSPRAAPTFAGAGRGGAVDYLATTIRSGCDRRNSSIRRREPTGGDMATAAQTALPRAIVLMAVAVLTVWWQHDWLKDRVYILKR